MKVSITCLGAMMLALSPLAVSAQSNDAAYCKALVQKYETYIGTMSANRTPESADARMAVNQCNASNPAGIPVLEQKLRNARIDLPPRT